MLQHSSGAFATQAPACCEPQQSTLFTLMRPAMPQAPSPSGLAAPPAAARPQPCGGNGGGCPSPPPPMPYLKARALAVGPMAPADRDTCLARTPAGGQSTVGDNGAVRCVPNGWPYPRPQSTRVKLPRSAYAVRVGDVVARVQCSCRARDQHLFCSAMDASASKKAPPAASTTLLHRCRAQPSTPTRVLRISTTQPIPCLHPTVRIPFATLHAKRSLPVPLGSPSSVEIISIGAPITTAAAGVAPPAATTTTTTGHAAADAASALPAGGCLDPITWAPYAEGSLWVRTTPDLALSASALPPLILSPLAAVASAAVPNPRVFSEVADTASRLVPLQ